jgi:NAD+ synthase (glutamine-hydrolysing)
MKVYIAQLNPTIGAFKANTEKVLKALDNAKVAKAQIVIFPEMILTGYPPQDFLYHQEFIEAAKAALEAIIPETKGIDAVIGTIRKEQGKLYNTAAVISDGKLLGYQDKRLLPTYDVFDEARYFTPGDSTRIFPLGGKKVVVTICEDLWFHSGTLKNITYPVDPVAESAELKPEVMLNLSASPYHFNKIGDRFFVAARAAETVGCPIVLCNQVGGNDSLIFDGTSVAIDAQGGFLAKLPSFQEAEELVDTERSPLHLTPADPMEELKQALVLGLRDYFYKSGFTKACLGLSGGIDSALVATLAAEALGPDHVTAVAMPSPYSSAGSLKDAEALAKNLKIPLLTIPITSPFETFLSTLQPHFAAKPVDVTEENLQARIRGMILMALSNKWGYLVLSTGNKSELAMGYSTLYGDLAGGLAVIADLTKEKVYALSRYINKNGEVIPSSILDKPPSAELRPNQKDSDSLPPYPLLDTVLTAYIEHGVAPEKIARDNQISEELVKELVHKILQSEYKRRQAPPGLRVTEKAFAVGRRFPIVHRFPQG